MNDDDPNLDELGPQVPAWFDTLWAFIVVLAIAGVLYSLVHWLVW